MLTVDDFFYILHYCMKREYVLTIPTSKFNEVGYFQGYCANIKPYIDLITAPNNAKFILRSKAEKDSRYKQLIPYAIIKNRNRFLAYKRGMNISEKRLANNLSIGFGGHITTKDNDFSNPNYEKCLLRELREEIHLTSMRQNNIVGMLNDDSNDVGRVHLGIVHLIVTDDIMVKPLEKEIQDLVYWDLETILNKYQQFENWSKICIDAYLNQLH